MRLTQRVRGLLLSILLAVFATLVALGLAEGAVRLLSVGEARVVPAEPLPPELRDLPELRGVGALVRRNARGIFKGVLHRTNDRGVRGPDYPRDPPAGTFRIAVVGDSYTMGQGVPEEAAYPAVAEKLLNERGDGRHYEVINLGVAGLAIRHSMRRLEKVGLWYQPHLLVYGFTPNDIQGPGYVEPSPEAQQAARSLIHRFEDSPSRLLALIWPRLVLARSAAQPLPGTYEYALEENYFRNEKAAAQIAENLDELARLAKSRGVCAHVFIHTRMNQLFFHPFTRIYRHVESLAHERGLGASVAFPFFRGRDVSELRLSVADSHPSAAGHRIHARALLAGLDALPERCFTPGHYVP